MTSRWIRLLLAVQAVGLAGVAIWPLVDPRGFYDKFPGGGHHWINVNGPYNEHFIRDFGALNAALLVVVIYAIWKVTPALVQAASLALIVYGIPHVLYHLGHLDVYGKTSEQFLAVGPLGLQIAAAVATLVFSSRQAGLKR